MIEEVMIDRRKFCLFSFSFQTKLKSAQQTFLPLKTASAVWIDRFHSIVFRLNHIRLGRYRALCPDTHDGRNYIATSCSIVTMTVNSPSTHLVITSKIFILTTCNDDARAQQLLNIRPLKRRLWTLIGLNTIRGPSVDPWAFMASAFTTRKWV